MVWKKGLETYGTDLILNKQEQVLVTYEKFPTHRSHVPLPWPMQWTPSMRRRNRPLGPRSEWFLAWKASSDWYDFPYQDHSQPDEILLACCRLVTASRKLPIVCAWPFSSMILGQSCDGAFKYPSSFDSQFTMSWRSQMPHSGMQCKANVHPLDDLPR